MDSMLPCIYSVIDHVRSQNVVRTSVIHFAITSCATLLLLPHFYVICDQLLHRCTARVKKGKVSIWTKWPTRPDLTVYLGFCSMKWQGVFLLPPLDGMPVHWRVIPSIKFASTHLYTWEERGTVRVQCLAQEHNAMFQTRAQTWTTRSGDERTNHEATAPPTDAQQYGIYLFECQV